MLDAPEAGALARFYVRLLGWRITAEEPEWVVLMPPEGVAYLAFQTESKYVPPVWPSTDGRRQMMMHLDLEVGDLEAAVAHAVEAGATLADHQPQETVRVLLDPAGHPFCLYTDTSSPGGEPG
ncbi:VOC family protein [Streptosporangium sp. NPDC023615]|uniref:VOC family protein n=1 Tax=Streptosporangium sp. NPDC023615 TaxID=3154794 RepID=UPI00343296FA